MTSRIEEKLLLIEVDRELPSQSHTHIRTHTQEGERGVGLEGGIESESKRGAL